ncbi:MAG TPA: alpha/beta fold hydrolase, partial [Ramlibacter sp.]|nr:alpha/beta fold hydrolase [Ramlibacter sp.]
MPQPLIETFHAPSLGLFATEPLRALLDFFAAHLGQPPLVEGDGHPVVVYPGLGAGAFNTTQLRQYLTDCKFTVHDWELGVNTGPSGNFDEWLDALVQRVLALHERQGRKVSLIGWSLGGLYAREVAKCCPQAVRQVVTLATPFDAVGDGHQTATLMKLLGGSAAEPSALLQARLRERPPVPTTSIFSK